MINALKQQWKIVKNKDTFKSTDLRLMVVKNVSSSEILEEFCIENNILMKSLVHDTIFQIKITRTDNDFLHQIQLIKK